ncbi:MAG: GntR family transcriptional regulator [Lentisphaeria bacterium]|nr:GntR family transcriptional regulator [Lentisphaeria bacterium]
MPGLKVHKDEAKPLPKQISSIIRMKIEQGEYRPGKKLKTIRQYANEFSVSPVTVIKALDILEEETLIERVPVKGVFVSRQASSAKKALTACFAFPEKEIIPSPGHRENWSLNFELFSGLFTGARRNGINLQLTYFEDDPSPELLAKQTSALKKFDFVIFTGGQLGRLQQAAARQQPTFGIASQFAPVIPGVIRVDYDRTQAMDELLTYLRKTGCRSAVAVASNIDGGRGRLFAEKAAAAGVSTPGGGLWRFDRRDPGRVAKMKARLLAGKVEFIFADHTDFVPDIYEAAFDAGLMPGRDFIVTGIASGGTFEGLFPRPTYLRIPRADMGEAIMTAAAEHFKTKKTADIAVPKFEVQIVEGKNFPR